MSKLQDRRVIKGITQDDLANSVNVSKRLIQSLEQGVRDINGTKLQTLLQICMTLNCRLEDILEGDYLNNLLGEYQSLRN